MGSIQTFLTIGGIVLLTILVLNYFQSSGNHSTISLDNEAIITGTGIAQSLTDEIQGKAFDEQTVSAPVNDPSKLSSILGKDPGESTPSTFDDVDDYNNYTAQDTLFKLGVFSSNVKVHYVTNMNPDNISFSQTFAKRIDIIVVNQYLTDTLKFNQVISY